MKLRNLGAKSGPFRLEVPKIWQFWERFEFPHEHLNEKLNFIQFKQIYRILSFYVVLEIWGGNIPASTLWEPLELEMINYSSNLIFHSEIELDLIIQIFLHIMNLHLNLSESMNTSVIWLSIAFANHKLRSVQCKLSKHLWKEIHVIK